MTDHDTELGLRQHIAMAVAKADVDEVMHLIARETTAAELRGEIDTEKHYLQLFLSLQEHAIRPVFAEFAAQLTDHANDRLAALQATINKDNS